MPTFALVVTKSVAVLVWFTTLIAAALTKVLLAVNVAPEVSVNALATPVVYTPVALITAAVPTLADVVTYNVAVFV